MTRWRWPALLPFDGSHQIRKVVAGGRDEQNLGAFIGVKRAVIARRFRVMEIARAQELPLDYQ